MSWETVIEFSSCDLYSHPEKKLRDHIISVADYCRSTNHSAHPNFSSLGYSNEETTMFSQILGICHDFGKATLFFQDYLFSDEKKRAKLKVKPETHHGLISAVFTYYCIKDIFKSRSDTANSLLPFIGFVLVRRHHGNLINFFDETADLRKSEKIDLLKRQCNSIDKDALKTVYMELVPEDTLFNFFHQIDSTILSIIQDGNIFNLKHQLEKIHPAPTMDVFTHFYYSLLLAGDKLDAAELSVNMKSRELRSTLVDSYREKQGFDKSLSFMHKLRNEIYEDVISKVSTLDLNQKIYSLNVPTGTGKTLTSVSFSLKLRERIHQETGFFPQIIYCLPFMSIIDQNYDVISSVFSSDYGELVPTDILLKHHHLADVSYASIDNEIYDEDASQLLIEGWYSEFVITTFVQFFHTIISNRNRAIRKYHKLANAILILDEVQSIPHHYWLLFHDMLQSLSQCLNLYVIFVTATQPLIFDEGKQGEIVELASRKTAYFHQLDRITLIFDQKPLMLQEFIKKVQFRIKTEPGKDFLIVLNTINSAKQIYKSLFSFSEPNTEYVFLSTFIIPKERLNRIRGLRNAENRKRKVIISTQLIEAGVDIDVDIVYRDMAPLDSINQVAGRCNRNNRQGARGEVNIVILKDNGKEFCTFIYSPFLLDKTRIVLEGKNVITENQFLSLNNQYFQLVKELHSEDTAQKNLTLIQYLKYSDLHKTFHLLSEDYPKIDVFVEYDDTARKLWVDFVEIKAKPILLRKREFLRIKREFLDYVISVPKAKAQKLFREDLGIGYISHEELKFLYDLQTGYMVSEGGTLIL